MENKGIDETPSATWNGWHLVDREKPKKFWGKEKREKACKI